MLSTVPTSAPERGRGRDSERRGAGLRPEVLGLDTLEAVRQLAQEGILDPGVLVFASDTNPGGSRKGANIGTQEEALCRLSTLRLAQEQLEYPIPVLGVAYIPQVQGLRPDFFNGQSICWLIQVVHPCRKRQLRCVLLSQLLAKALVMLRLPSGVVTFGAICSALRQCLADETPTAKEAKFLEAGCRAALCT